MILGKNRPGGDPPGRATSCEPVGRRPPGLLHSKSPVVSTRIRKEEAIYLSPCLIMSWIWSYSTRTMAEPTVRRALAPAPLKKAVMPSSFMILEKQSAVPL